MTFPTITFKHTNIEPDADLQALVEHKFAPLSKYIGDETDVSCDVEFEKRMTKTSGIVCRMEANLWLAGTLYRAEANDESFEKSVDEVRNELDKELRRARSKRETLIKRGGRRLKEMMRFGR